MTIIPMDWVDKIFETLERFYEDRWSKNFQRPDSEQQEKTIWRNGLVGLTQTEIRNALVLCRRHAVHPTASIPHVMEFYRYAKGTHQPNIHYKVEKFKAGDPEVAKKYLDEIKRKVNLINAIG